MRRWDRKYLLILMVVLHGIVGGVWSFERVGAWLSKSDAPEAADLIICLNGEERTEKAAKLYRQGIASDILLTVSRTGEELINKKVPAGAVHLAPGVRTTFDEARAARAYVDGRKIGSAVVVSDPYHLSRVRWSFEKAFENLDTRLTFIASDLPWPKQGWFKDPLSRYLVASEVSKTVFYWMYHGIMDRQTTPEWVFKWKHLYLGWLKRICSA